MAMVVLPFIPTTFLTIHLHHHHALPFPETQTTHYGTLSGRTIDSLSLTLPTARDSP